MEVKIYAKLFFMSFFEMFSKAQQLKHLRKGEPSRLVEGAVEILAKQAGPVVSSDNTVRVEHGHYIEDIFAANLASHRVRTANKLNKPLSNVGRVRLSRMDARSHQCHFLARIVLIIANFEDRNSQSRQCPKGGLNLYVVVDF